MAEELVLVIEDDPAQMTLICDELAERGCRVIRAWTGEEGISRAKELLPAMVVVDFHISKNMNGIDVLNRLRADPATAKMIILAVTGTATGEDSARIQRAGFDGIVIKPIPSSEFDRILAMAPANRKDRT